MTRIALALAVCLGGGLPALGCANRSAAPPERVPHVEPRWQDAFDDTPQLLVVVRPKALRQDKVYGPLLRRAIDLARARSQLVSATPLEAIEDAEEVVIGVHRGGRERDDSDQDFVMVVLGVRADIDPGTLVDAGGRALWTPGPSGPVRELVRERDERGLPVAASLFELPGRAWVIGSGEARARAREAFAHPFKRPGMDLDLQALAIVRIDGPSLVARVRALQTTGSHAALGRRLRTLTLRLPPGANGDVELALAYADEDAAAFAEATTRAAVSAIARKKPDRLAWLGATSVDRVGEQVTLTIPLPGTLVDGLLRAGSAGEGLTIPEVDPRTP